VQGGLGAGSANAAAALLALGHELGSELGPEREGRMPAPERLRLAAEVGSDVPLFLVGGAVVGVGRGEEVYPLPEMESLACVLALPDIGVSTPQAFRDWDARQAPPAAEQNAVKDLAKGCGEEATALTPISRSATINMLSRSIAAAFSVPYSSGVFSQGEDRAETPLLALVRTGIENDFEQVVFSKYPLLGDVKRVLSGGSSPEERSVYAALSGSGSALFGLYRTDGASQAALERLQAMGVPGVVTRTLTRDEYWRTMRV
jgi:4-diphosphocytidyl-2-C-methyl-D-erythritol kinase